jgi:hypothetical protein
VETRDKYTRAELDALTKNKADRQHPTFGHLPGPWRNEAECGTSGVHPDLWFSDEPEDEAAAKAICDTCPVRRECLLHALQEGEKMGTWGGLTPTERKDEATVRAKLEEG